MSASRVYQGSESNGAGVVGRVSRLEAQVENVSRDVGLVVKNQEANAERSEREFARLRDLILEKSKQPLSTWISFAFLIIALFGMGLTPMWIKIGTTDARANDAVRYGEMDKTVKEIETQFNGVGKEMQTQINNNQANNDAQTKEIDRLRVARNEDDIKTAKLEQQMTDHDKYLWPRVEQHTNMMSTLNVLVGENSQAIAGLLSREAGVYNRESVRGIGSPLPIPQQEKNK